MTATKLVTEPPFPVGAQVRYIGCRKWGKPQASGETLWVENGSLGIITKVVPAARGAGWVGSGDDRFYDHGDDAYSVAQWHPGVTSIIWPNRAGEYVQIEGEVA